MSDDLVIGLLVLLAISGWAMALRMWMRACSYYEILEQWAREDRR